jgi:hypothetical protein
LGRLVGFEEGARQMDNEETEEDTALIFNYVGDASKNGESSDALSIWTLKVSAVAGEEGEDLKEVASLRFKIVDLYKSQGFETFDDDSHDLALIYHLLFGLKGELRPEFDIYGDSPNRILLFYNEENLPPEHAEEILKHVEDMFHNCLLIVLPRTGEQRAAFDSMGFSDIIPPKTLAIELMPAHDINAMTAELQGMIADPEKRLMWKSSDVPWSSVDEDDDEDEGEVVVDDDDENVDEDTD